MPELIAAGLMSGTSLDGIDAVIAAFGDDRPRLLSHHFVPFPAELRRELGALCASGEDEIERCGRAAVTLARLSAEAVRGALAGAGLSADRLAVIGSHGQTLRHRPEQGWSLQLNDPALLAELTGVDVVADFRSRDLAAGGQGAPLVPAFHEAVFRAPGVARCVVNIGGMANVTVLPPADEERPVTGFDCGPGNTLLDAWCRRHRGQDFDADGAWAQSGTVDRELLRRLRAEPFFALPPPKSTGRELFNLAWLDARLSGEAPADVQATLLALTAETIHQAIIDHAPGTSEIFLCGGGAANPALVRAIATLAGPGVKVSDTGALGVAPRHVEALAFAWLAWRFRCHLPGSLPAVTGARGPRPLGCLYPA